MLKIGEGRSFCSSSEEVAGGSAESYLGLRSHAAELRRRRKEVLRGGVELTMRQRGKVVGINKRGKETSERKQLLNYGLMVREKAECFPRNDLTP